LPYEAIPGAPAAQLDGNCKPRGQPAAMVPALEMEDDTGADTIRWRSSSTSDETRCSDAADAIRPATVAHQCALAQTIGCDIHPLGNLRVLKLPGYCRVTDEAKLAWSRRIVEGFTALEAMLAGAPGSGGFCRGDTPTAGRLLPQRLKCSTRVSTSTTSFPTIARIHGAYSALGAFERQSRQTTRFRIEAMLVARRASSMA
jgi:hypothetical protein